MRVIARNLKEMERRVSPTSHAKNSFASCWIRLMRSSRPGNRPSVLLSSNAFLFDNTLGARETITEALEVYESFHVLETLPTRWSLIHLFKCNCRTCFIMRYVHIVLLASMVCVARRPKSHSNT